MRKNSVFLASVAVMSLLLGIAYQGGKRTFLIVMAASDINVKPYVRAYTSFHMSGGARVTMAEVTESRRSDGAIHRLEVPYQGKIPAPSREMVEFLDGVEVRIMANSKSTIQRPMDAVAAAKELLLHLPAQCALKGEVVDGEDTLFQQAAFRVIRMDGTDERWVNWKMPAFDCAVVQSWHQKASSDGSWTTEGGSLLTNFAPANPAPELFTRWLAYDEVGPSELRRRFYRAAGIPQGVCATCYADDAGEEARYKELHHR